MWEREFYRDGAQKTAPDLISEGDGCCYDEDGELPEVLFFTIVPDQWSLEEHQSKHTRH